MVETDTFSAEEIMSRVRKIELRALKLAREAFSGEYHSAFKGQGLDFDEFKEYHAGDETRFIDWNVTARTGDPYVRSFKEERELSVILAVDISSSIACGSGEFSKREIAAELVATLGFSALQNNDKVGLFLYANEGLKFYPPVKGRKHLLRLIRETLMFESQEVGTGLESASRKLQQWLKRKSMIVFISDFLHRLPEKSFKALAQKHDVLAARLIDPLEVTLPAVGRVSLMDPESGESVLVNTNRQSLREAYAEKMQSRRERMRGALLQAKVNVVDIFIEEDFLPPLHQLLIRQSKR